MNGNWRYAFIYASMTLALLFRTGGVAATPTDNPQILSSFCPPPNGFIVCVAAYNPTDLVRGSDGAYYGITKYGAYYSGQGGVVYRVDPGTRKVSIFHRFDAKTEGESPLWLRAGSDGYLYGALRGGGSAYSGNIFRLSLAGEFTKLRTFPVSGGHVPPLIPPVEVNGVWFGVADHSDGSSRLFRFSPSEGYKPLSEFPYPYSDATDLVLASDGNVYGTTASYYSDGKGTIFRITQSGVVTTLHYFDGVTDGTPEGGLVVGPDGALYGTVSLSDREALYRMTLDGQFTLMNTFGDAPLYRPGPSPELTLMPDGYFYGTRASGSASVGYQSEIFRLSLTGEYTQLHVFADDSEGGFSEAPLIRGFDNALYGTNSSGGKNFSGTVFRYVPPPVQ